MGRLEGRFHSPRDPLEYRRRSGIDHYHDYSVNIAHDNRHGTSSGASLIPPTPNYDAAAAASHPYTSNSPFRTDSVNASPQERQFRTTQKLQEYDLLLYELNSKGYIPSDVAKTYSVWVYNSVQSGRTDILDQNHNMLRRWVKALN